ncbi:MAG: M48 family metallopeptidase [Steroidobacteraceae bacterium]
MTIAFLTALALHVLVQLWLSHRQTRHVAARRHEVPPAFADAVSAAEHAKAADYTVARQRLGRLDLVYDAIVLLILTLGGGIAALGRLATAIAGQNPIGSGTLHVLLALLAMSLASLPISVWRTFVLEARFGFNRTTAAVFVADLLKGAVLGGLLGGSVVALVLWTMAASGTLWWLVAWAVWMAISLLLLWAWPRWIAGFFNKFTPLTDAALRERIDALLARCDFHARDVYVMDGSKRSAHGNAYFTGLGREKRIVFYDTLAAVALAGTGRGRACPRARALQAQAHPAAAARERRHVARRLRPAGMVVRAGLVLRCTGGRSARPVRPPCCCSSWCCPRSPGSSRHSVPRGRGATSSRPTPSPPASATARNWVARWSACIAKTRAR